MPRKNIYPLAGKPLIWYTFQAAKTSKLLTRFILSTNNEEIAACGRKHQVELPFIRPPELARDDSSSLDVIIHAVTFLEQTEGYRPDLIVLLQPTAPLRQGRHIDEAIRRQQEGNAEAVISVTPVPGHFNPHWLFVVDETDRLTSVMGDSGHLKYPRRQELPPAYYRNGAVYVARRELVMEQKSLYGSEPLAYIMPPNYSVNIDSIEDMQEAERLLQIQKSETSQ